MAVYCSLFCVTGWVVGGVVLPMGEGVFGFWERLGVGFFLGIGGYTFRLLSFGALAVLRGDVREWGS